MYLNFYSSPQITAQIQRNLSCMNDLIKDYLTTVLFDYQSMATWISTLTAIIFIYSHLITFYFCSKKSTTIRQSNKSRYPSPSPIVGDYRKARDDEFPYLVMISEVIDNNWIPCAGTLIRPNWVLTARHCILYFDWNTTQPEPEKKLRKLVVTPKYSNKRSRLNGTKKYKISKMFCNHVTRDGYDSAVADVAMLKLTESVPIGNSEHKFKTIRLVEKRNQIDWGLKFRIPGWGSNKRGPKITRKDYPDDLLVIDTLFNKRCIDFFPSFKSPQTYCIGDSKRTMAYGDDGDPAIARDDQTDEDLQAGIYTRGQNIRGQMNGPSLFANVTYYSVWILNTIIYENPDDECKNIYGNETRSNNILKKHN
ncbi:tryptase-like [Brevipalpus obovatus]|uniref:tryptase-like n=1 Tax=Brevipalpus obovatus TaxID=246614 RepID=UPI003D9EA634